MDIGDIKYFIIMIDQRLQQFLEKELLTRWSKPVNFNPEMKLYKDFKLSGEDAEDFIQHFMQEFNVTLGEDFTFSDRFYLEFDLNLVKNIFAPIFAVFNKNTRPQIKDVSIAELQEAIDIGVLK